MEELEDGHSPIESMDSTSCVVHRLKYMDIALILSIGYGLELTYEAHIR